MHSTASLPIVGALFFLLNSMKRSQHFNVRNRTLCLFKREFAFDATMRLWEAIWANHLTTRFETFLSAAIIVRHRAAVLEQRMSFDELLRFVNDLAYKCVFDVGAVLFVCRSQSAQTRSRTDHSRRQFRLSLSLIVVLIFFVKKITTTTAYLYNLFHRRTSRNGVVSPRVRTFFDC